MITGTVCLARPSPRIPSLGARNCANGQSLDRMLTKGATTTTCNGALHTSQICSLAALLATALEAILSLHGCRRVSACNISDLYRMSLLQFTAILLDAFDLARTGFSLPHANKTSTKYVS